MVDKVGELFISEILARGADGSVIEAEMPEFGGRGGSCVEISNSTDTTQTLAGIEIWSEKMGLLYAFGLDETIGPRGSAAVVGAHDPDRQPGTDIPGDAIFLLERPTGDYSVLSYGRAAREPLLPIGFPGSHRIGQGEHIESELPQGMAYVRGVDGKFSAGAPNAEMPNATCFLEGSKIETQDGMRAIEDLQPGDYVRTRDHGWQPVLAMSHQTFSEEDMKAWPATRPVIMGVGGEETAVSPSHRVLFDAASAALFFAGEAVLVTARDLMRAGVAKRWQEQGPVNYWHILLPVHTAVWSGGLWVESFHKPFPGAWSTPNGATWVRGETAARSRTAHGPASYPTLSGHEARVLLASAPELMAA